MVSDLECIEVRRGSGVGMLFIGLAVGVLAGGIAALLYAPRSGRETREMFKSKAAETQEMLKERVGQVRERVGHMAQRMRSSAESEMRSTGTQP